MATSKVLQLPSPAQLPESPERVSQTELVLVLSLRTRKLALEEQLREAERDIIGRLEAGAPVEPGAHLAKLEEHWRRNVAWKDVVERLADRLGLNGEAYCANVLGNTKPSRSVSLFVA